MCSWGLHMRRFSTRVCLEFNLLQSRQRFSVWFNIQLQLRFSICSGRLQSREHCIFDTKTLRVCQVEVVRAVNAGKQGAPRLCQIWHLEQEISHLFYFMYRSFLLWARNLVDSRGRVFLGHASVELSRWRDPPRMEKMKPLFSWINSCDKTNILLKSNKLYQTLLTLTKPY